MYFVKNFWILKAILVGDSLSSAMIDEFELVRFILSELEIGSDFL